MGSLGHVRERGQVTLPEPVLKEAGLEPGDVVAFRTVESGVVEIKALPRLTLAEALERFKVEDPFDEAAIRDAWQDDAAKEVIGE